MGYDCEVWVIIILFQLPFLRNVVWPSVGPLRVLSVLIRPSKTRTLWTNPRRLQMKSSCSRSVNGYGKTESEIIINKRILYGTLETWTVPADWLLSLSVGRSIKWRMFYVYRWSLLFSIYCLVISHKLK